MPTLPPTWLRHRAPPDFNCTDRSSPPMKKPRSHHCGGLDSLALRKRPAKRCARSYAIHSKTTMVPEAGIEPARLAAGDFESPCEMAQPCGFAACFSAWNRSFLTRSGWCCGNGFCLEFTAPVGWQNLYWIPMPLTILHNRRAGWRESATSEHIVSFVRRIRALRARFRGDAVHLTALNFSAFVR